MRALWSSLATTTSTASSMPLRPSFQESNTRCVYCSMSSGCVLGTIRICNWLPLRCCSASACCWSRCFDAASSVPVVSTTGESSAGIAASCCARTQGAPHSRASNSSVANGVRRMPSATVPRSTRRGGLRCRRRRVRLRRRVLRHRLVEVAVRRVLDRRLVLHREIRLLLVPEHLGGQVHRELADVGVVVLHQLDVAAARDG